MEPLISFDDFPDNNLGYKNYYELECELTNANIKISNLERNIESITKRLIDLETENINNKTKTLDIFKYYRSAIQYCNNQSSGINLTTTQIYDMIFKRFYEYNFSQADLVSQSIITTEYQELPERIAQRKRDMETIGY